MGRKPHRGAVGSGGGEPAELVAARAGRDEHGRVLVEATVAVLPGWVERSVTSRLAAGPAVEDGDVAALIARAAAAAVEDGRPRLEAAVTREPGIDPGPAPLQVLRSLVRHPTDALLALGVPGVDRPAFETEAFPDDVYDLSPATWADVHPSLHEPGLAWGAATAYLHKVRRRTV